MSQDRKITPDDISQSATDDFSFPSISTDGLSSRQADIAVWKEGSTVKAGSRSGLVEKGSDAATVVQAALDQLHSNGGGTLWVTSGQYTQTKEIDVYSDITFVGAGMGQTVFTDTGQHGWRVDGSVTTLTGFVVKDLTYDGSNNGGGANMFFDGSPTRCTAERVEVLNAGERGGGGSGGGFAFRGGSENQLIDCRAENCAAVSLSLQVGANNAIWGCVVKDPNTGSTFTHGISVEGSDYSKVVGCLVYGGDTANPGINMNRVSYGVCDGNTIQNVVKGINVANGNARNSVISNNTIENVSGRGMEIQVTTGGTTVDNILVTGNTAKNTTGFGIQVHNGAVADIIGNNLIDVGTQGGPGGRGIYINNLSSGDYYRVSGNKIINAGNRGISVSGRVLCGGNYIENAGYRSIDVGATDSLFVGNMAVGGSDNMVDAGSGNVWLSNSTTGSIHPGTNSQIIGLHGGVSGTPSNASLIQGATGFNPQGWATASPSIPATGSSNSVTNSHPYPVLVYQTGASGTHVIGPSGTDTALPADDQPITLSPSAQIYYASSAPSSWDWYGK